MIVNCVTTLTPLFATAWRDMLSAIHVGAQTEPSLSMLVDEMAIRRNLSGRISSETLRPNPDCSGFQQIMAPLKDRKFWEPSHSSHGDKTDMEVHRPEDTVLNANRSAYSRIVDHYSAVSYKLDGPRWRARCREVFLQHLVGTDILEIGSGPAFDSEYFFRQGFNVTATDYCEGFIDYVKTRNPHMRTHLMDFTRPDLPRESFDGIYGLSCFLHIPHSLALATLAALYSLLRTKGCLFLVLIESEKVSSYIIDNWYMDGNPVTFFCYPREEMRELLLKSGFKEIDIFDYQSSNHTKLARLEERKVKVYQIMAKR